MTKHETVGGYLADLKKVMEGQSITYRGRKISKSDNDKFVVSGAIAFDTLDEAKKQIDKLSDATKIIDVR